MPPFLLGLILVFFLFFQLHLAGVDLFPGSGYVGILANPASWAQHMVLPWVTLALVTATTYERLTRGALLDVLGEDYIRTARAKGLSERRVVYRHGLRSASDAGRDPVAGVSTSGTLLGGAIVVENVFGLPGLGALAVTSVDNQDLPVIIGLVMVASAFIVVANIVVDLVYAFLDPRVPVLGDQLKRRVISVRAMEHTAPAAGDTASPRQSPQWPFICHLTGRAGGFVEERQPQPWARWCSPGERGRSLRRPLQWSATKVGLRSPQRPPGPRQHRGGYCSSAMTAGQMVLDRIWAQPPGFLWPRLGRGDAPRASWPSLPGTVQQLLWDEGGQPGAGPGGRARGGHRRAHLGAPPLKAPPRT